MAVQFNPQTSHQQYTVSAELTNAAVAVRQLSDKVESAKDNQGCCSKTCGCLSNVVWTVINVITWPFRKIYSLFASLFGYGAKADTSSANGNSTNGKGEPKPADRSSSARRANNNTPLPSDETNPSTAFTTIAKLFNQPADAKAQFESKPVEFVQTFVDAYFQNREGFIKLINTHPEALKNILAEAGNADNAGDTINSVIPCRALLTAVLQAAGAISHADAQPVSGFDAAQQRIADVLKEHPEIFTPAALALCNFIANRVHSNEQLDKPVQGFLVETFSTTIPEAIKKAEKEVLAKFYKMIQDACLQDGGLTYENIKSFFKGENDVLNISNSCNDTYSGDASVTLALLYSNPTAIGQNLPTKDEMRNVMIQSFPLKEICEAVAAMPELENDQIGQHILEKLGSTNISPQQLHTDWAAIMQAITS